MKVKKIKACLKPSYVELMSSPTIHVGLTGRVIIVLDDDTVILDGELFWEDEMKYINTNLSPVECKSIENQIRPYMTEFAQNFCKSLSAIVRYDEFEIDDD